MSNEKIVKIGLVFYLSSIIGFVYELIISIVKDGKYNQGILYGPWLPIYGIGSILIILLLDKYKRYPWLIFVLSFFLTGLLELTSGYILHKFFHIRLWNYTGWFLNIKGYVCLLSAVCFGIGGLLTIYFLKPFTYKLINRNKKWAKKILIIISLLFSLDIVLSIVNF